MCAPALVRFASVTSLVVAIGVGVLPPVASATDCVDYSEYVHYLGGLQLAGSTPFVLAGQIAYLESGDSLHTVDISNPSAPSILGSVAINTSAFAIDVVGDYAYVVDGFRQKDLQIIDASNPANPVVIGALDRSAGTEIDVAVSGDIAYIADAGSGAVIVIDVSDPEAPAQIGSFGIGRPYEVDLRGNLLYVRGGVPPPHLSILDVTNPASPTLLSALDLGEYGDAFDVQGDIAYVVSSSSGLLRVLDVADPSDPQVISTTPVASSDWATSIDVSGNYAYVSAVGMGLRVVDVSDPLSPRVVGAADTPYASEIGVQGTIAYLSTSFGFETIDISVPVSAPIAHSIDTPDSASRVAIDGHYAFVADGASGVQVIDLSDPLGATIVGSYDTPGIAKDIVVSAPFAYVADGDAGLLILNVSSPANPTLVGSVATPGTGPYASSSLDIRGNHVYLADVALMLTIDVSDRTSPVITNAVDTYYARAVAVRGDYAYVLNDLGYNSTYMNIFNVSNPAQAMYAGEIEGVGEAGDIVVHGDKAYVAASRATSSEARLREYDISTPGTPVLTRAQLIANDGTGVARLGDHVYVTSISGLQAIDLTLPPGASSIIGSIPLDGPASGIAMYGSFAVVAAGAAGVKIVPVHCASATGVASAPDIWDAGRLTASPNPSREGATLAFALNEPLDVRVDVYDLAGRHVRRLFDGPMLPGDQSLRWDARDGNAKPVASGVYLLRLETPKGSKSTRVALLR